MNPRVGLPTGFALLLGGTLLLAFTQVTRVFVDPRRTEASASDTIGDVTWVFLSALLLAVGLMLALASVSRAKGGRRVLALTAVGCTTFLLLMLHLTLFINSITVGTEDDLSTFFTASYLFHTGELYSLIAVFLILLVTLTLLGILVAAAGSLLVPGRFMRALWSRDDWGRLESSLVASSLFLVFGLTLFVVFLVRVVVRLEVDPLPAGGFLTEALPAFYYLQICFVGLLILTVAARVFLVNWGTQVPIARATVQESLFNVGRLERVLAAAALVFNLLILGAPAATSDGLSDDPVFLLNSRGLAWFFFLLVVPYLPYALSLRGLSQLLDEEGLPMRWSPFSQHSLRVVLATLGGMVLLAAAGIGGRWSPLTMMLSLTGWMAVVMAGAGLRFRLEHGSFSPHLRNAASGPYLFAAILLGVCSGLMMWGAGNTYVATYTESGQALQIQNASPFGADILLRIGGASVLSLCLLLPLAVAKTSLGIRRSMLVPQVVGFSSLVVMAIVVFSVSVWYNPAGGTSDALAGFSFHQFGTEEKWMVAGLVLALGASLFWSFGRLVGGVARPRLFPQVFAARQVR